MPDTIAWVDLLFAAAFASQVFSLSFYFPTKLSGMNKVFRNRAAADEAAPSLRDYLLLNYAIGLIGLCLLVALFYYDAFSNITVTLLAIGACFFLQLSPIALRRVRGLSGALRSAAVTQNASSGRASLFAFVSPLPVALAVLLFVCYLTFAIAQWDGALNTRLLQTIIFTSTQALFAGMIAWNLAVLKRSSAEKAADHHRNLTRLVPMFVFASMLISTYYFGKELIAVFDLGRFRPTMMSAFLQLIAFLMFDTLFPRGGRGAQGEVGR